mmetsp:Transcript_6177/g.15285  ORF Transcript_6177/g.15285 Transcript_6177/m.15285 type:complete len:108 (-) Transcript_6177:35-358(-)
MLCAFNIVFEKKVEEYLVLMDVHRCKDTELERGSAGRVDDKMQLSPWMFGQPWSDDSFASRQFSQYSEDRREYVHGYDDDVTYLLFELCTFLEDAELMMMRIFFLAG